MGASGEDRATLAIVGTPATRAFSDLLQAGLSGSGFADFVEREEIERILQEQRLSLTSERSVLTLAGLVAADGLILLTSRREGDVTYFQVRLVAVKPGVVLDLIQLPWPLQDVDQVTSQVASRFAPLLPKLFVLERDAVPISLLNLRSAVTTGTSRDTERTLTLLLATRLSVEPEVFVLERTRMDLLREEKEIAFDDSAFWAGSYLIEGVIDGDAYSAESISVSVRLAVRDGKTVEFEANGPRENLPQVVETMARGILDGLDHGASGKEWDLKEEATRYFHEGLWALRWGMYPEARHAAVPAMSPPELAVEVPWAGLPETAPLQVNRRIRIPVEAAGFRPEGKMTVRAVALEEDHFRVLAAYQEPGNHGNPWNLLGARSSKRKMKPGCNLQESMRATLREKTREMLLSEEPAARRRGTLFVGQENFVEMVPLLRPLLKDDTTIRSVTATTRKTTYTVRQAACDVLLLLGVDVDDVVVEEVEPSQGGTGVRPKN